MCVGRHWFSAHATRADAHTTLDSVGSREYTLLHATFIGLLKCLEKEREINLEKLFNHLFKMSV